MLKRLLVLVCAAWPVVAVAQVSDLFPDRVRESLRNGESAALHAERTRLLDSLAAGRRRWQASGVREYEIETHVGCFCVPLPPNSTNRLSLITVRDGRIVSRAEGREHPMNTELLTVDSLFSAVENDLRDAGRVAKRLALDPVYGFPVWYEADTPGIADVWLELRVDTFVVRAM